MHITLIPQRRDDALTLHRAGNVLIINGVAYDFGPLPEGAVLPRAAVECPLLVSDVTREGGQVRLALILPHGPDAPPEALFPVPITATADGAIALPVTYANDHIGEADE